MMGATNETDEMDATDETGEKNVIGATDVMDETGEGGGEGVEVAYGRSGGWCGRCDGRWRNRRR